ncbi:hypothetical protein EYF80_033969 [Liparis tanakae]|uniref:Uncharacterized protein n=1 Tax=Liparis tanakae TaxID=230148 RepID=A0A4Z2GQE7_9TELE|nr:hypothetical protein EYF80_033969 [Liparis tanakae]
MPCVREQKSHDVIRLIRSGVKHGHTIRNRPEESLVSVHPVPKLRGQRSTQQVQTSTKEQEPDPSDSLQNRNMILTNGNMILSNGSLILQILFRPSNSFMRLRTNEGLRLAPAVMPQRPNSTYDQSEALIDVKPTEIIATTSCTTTTTTTTSSSSSITPMMLYRCFWNVFRGQGSQPAIQEESLCRRKRRFLLRNCHQRKKRSCHSND